MSGNPGNYFHRGRGGGRGYGPTPGSSRNEDEGASTSNPPKKKKFNPFWRARGGGGRGSGGGGWSNWNQNPVEKPAAVPLPSNLFNQVQGASTSAMDIDDVDDDLLEGRPVKQATLKTDCLGNKDFPYWRLYFPFLDYEDALPQVKHIKAFEAYYEENWETFHQGETLETHGFTLSYKKLLANSKFMEAFPDFAHRTKHDPDNLLQSAAIAMHQVLQRKKLSNGHAMYYTHLIEFQPVTTLERAMDTQNIDTMVSIRGTVMRVSDTEYHDRFAVFQCTTCGKEQMVFQPNSRRTFPLSCFGGCRARSRFETVLGVPLHILEPYQKIRVQESINCGRLNSAVNYIAVALTNDLVDLISAGDDIILTGVLKVTREPSGANNGMLVPKEYIEATSTVGAKHTVTVQRANFTEKDMRAIEKIRSMPSPFRLLVNSLNDRIIGHEMIKAGLILSLLGGGEGRTTRDNIHILMVGDPGMGKSELMKSCCAVAPKAIYAVSSHLSGAGLTASVRRATNRFVIDAGALVLADGGVCCIDEIDKKVSMHSDLLDAMERQKVSVVKMGNRVNLQARTTIIAAGNPVGNVYDKTKTIAENLKMGPALLSRFDLVFIMVDSYEHKERLAQHRLLQGYTNSQNKPTMEALMAQRKAKLYPTFSSLDNPTTIESKWPLEEFLKIKTNEAFEPLPEILLQNYIGYARKTCFPKISEEVGEVMEKFYLELRQMERTCDILPVTIRQLQALRRLAVARARADLASEVTMQHVAEIIELTKFSMHHVFETETGELDLSRGIHGSGVSKRNKKMQFLQILKRKYDQTGIDTFSMDQLKQVAKDMQLDKLYEVIDSLNHQCLLMMVAPNVYKIVTN